MGSKINLDSFKQIPIVELAERLGIKVRGTKAMCFTGHDKDSPSLSFHKGKNTWRCFGACGKHGDTINLVMEVEGLDFKSAIEWLSQNFSVSSPLPISGQRLRVPTKKARLQIVRETKSIPEDEFQPDTELYEWFISKCDFVTAPEGMQYLHSHGISSESANRFNIRQLSNPQHALSSLVRKWGAQRVFKSGITWGRNGRPESLIWDSYALIFPFYENEQITYIQARMFSGKRKFINLRGIAKPLFNLNRLIGLPSGETVHLCEGVPDTIALESQDLFAVGILGATSFHPKWVDRFLKYRVVILGDGDAAGRKFASDISNYFMDRGKPVQSMPMPEGKDVSDVLTMNRDGK